MNRAGFHLLVLLLASGGLAGLGSTRMVAESKAAPTVAQPGTPATHTNTAPIFKKAPARAKLSGAELYSIHCNRCHPERYPTERTAAQWKTILLHMRVRANLPAEQARTILQYLQENSGR